MNYGPPASIQGRWLFTNARKTGESPCSSCGVVKRSDRSPHLDSKADFSSTTSQHSQSPWFDTGPHVVHPLQFQEAASMLVAPVGQTYLLLHFKRHLLIKGLSHSPWIMQFGREGRPVHGAGIIRSNDGLDNDDLDLDDPEVQRELLQVLLRKEIARISEAIDRLSEIEKILLEKKVKTNENLALLQEEIAKLEETGEKDDTGEEQEDDTSEKSDDPKNDECDKDKPRQDSPQSS